MNAGKLDRRIQFRRGQVVDDGFNSAIRWDDANPASDNHGGAIHASKVAVSDGEKFRASEVSANITTRFVVRWSAFTADLTPKDRLTCEGLEYEIVGIKEGKGRRQWLEITAAGRIDQ